MRRGLALAACVLAITLAAYSQTRAQAQSTYNVTLSRAEASTDAHGRTIVTMTTRGDLPGTMTLAIERRADGTVTGGEWALNVSYTQLTAPDGHVEAADIAGGDDETVPHAEALVQKGVIKGQLVGGSVTLGADGALATFNDLVMSVTSGTLAFDRAASGNGVLSGASLSDRDASNGAVTITF